MAILLRLTPTHNELLRGSGEKLTCHKSAKRHETILKFSKDTSINDTRIFKNFEKNIKFSRKLERNVGLDKQES